MRRQPLAALAGAAIAVIIGLPALRLNGLYLAVTTIAFAIALDQFFLWRPFKSSVNHRTYVPNVYHIGASTHPGPGLGGVSGFLLASSL